MSDERYDLIELSRSSADEFIKSICKIDPVNRKSRSAPLQGRPWKEWCRLKKDQLRNEVPEEFIESFIASKEQELKIMRIEQFKLIEQMRKESPIIRLSENVSRTHDYDQNTLQYYLNWIEILMNDIGRAVVADVVNKYHAELKQRRQQRHNLNDKSDLKSEKLELQEQLEDCSFEFLHIFREFSQMYECTLFHKNKSASNLDGNILNLPNVVANMMLHGWPFELMDGSVAFVPLDWVTAVFREIENIIGHKKIFSVGGGNTEFWEIHSVECHVWIIYKLSSWLSLR